jgi:hypothetical protein
MSNNGVGFVFPEIASARGRTAELPPRLVSLCRPAAGSCGANAPAAVHPGCTANAQRRAGSLERAELSVKLPTKLARQIGEGVWLRVEAGLGIAAVRAARQVDEFRRGADRGDETGNGYDGTYFGNPTFGEVGAIKGDDNAAVKFNGGDYVEIPDPDSAAFSQPTSGFGVTVEVWMRPDVLDFPGQAPNPYVHWLGKRVAGRYEWALRFYSKDSNRPNRISAYMWNPTSPPHEQNEGAGAYFPDELVPGEWIHVVACYQPGDKDTVPPTGVQIWKDGHFRKGPPSSGTLYSNPKFNVVPAHGTAPLRLGTRDLGSFLIGALDDVAIYPRVLTESEIVENCLNGIS